MPLPDVETVQAAVARRGLKLARGTFGITNGIWAYKRGQMAGCKVCACVAVALDRLGPDEFVRQFDPLSIAMRTSHMARIFGVHTNELMAYADGFDSLSGKPGALAPSEYKDAFRLGHNVAMALLSDEG